MRSGDALNFGRIWTQDVEVWVLRARPAVTDAHITFAGRQLTEDGIGRQMSPNVNAFNGTAASRDVCTGGL